MEKIEMEINPIKVNTERSIVVYEVTIESRGGIWTETWGTKDLLEAFLQGVKAALSFTEVKTVGIPPSLNLDKRQRFTLFEKIE